MDEEDFQLVAIQLYRTVELEADVDPDHDDTDEHVYHNHLVEWDVSTNPSSAPVADALITIPISEVIAIQKTDAYSRRY